MTTRLAADADIRAVFAARRTAHGRAVVVHARNRDGAPAATGRAAVVAGRKVGGAVARNRAKRRVREALRATGVPAGVDVVVVARSGACSEPFADLCDQLRSQLVRATAPPEPGTHR